METTSGLLVASRTDGDRAGLHRFTRKNEDWLDEHLVAVADLAAMCWHPTLPLIYGVCGAGEGKLYVWDLTGSIVEEVQSDATHGTVPCDVAVDPSGTFLVVTNFGNGSPNQGSVTVWPLDVQGRAGAAYGAPIGYGQKNFVNPHQAVFHEDELFIPDLGADVIHVLVVSTSHPRELVPRSQLVVPDGTGPRHLHIAGDTLVVSGELSSEVVRVDRSSGQVSSQLSTAEIGAAKSRGERNYPGDIQVSPVGNHVYVANRGYDTIACFRLADEWEGPLAELAVPAWPQHILVLHGGLLVASWDASVVSFVHLARGVPVDVVPLFDCPGAAWILRDRPVVVNELSATPTVPGGS